MNEVHEINEIHAANAANGASAASALSATNETKMSESETLAPLPELDEEAELPEAQSEEETEEQSEEEEKDIRDIIKEWVKDLAIAVITAVLILQFIKPTIVQEHSMENTLVANDYLFISKQSYTLFGDPKRGDIIVFHSDLTTADGAEKLLVKRIIAIPGDTIYITGGVVYVNGQALDEPYTKDGYTDSEMAEVFIPEGKLFCMGDNRQNSRDSHDDAIGLVDESDVICKAVLRLFPFSRFGGLYD